jgi:hypothetical protein
LKLCFNFNLRRYNMAEEAAADTAAALVRAAHAGAWVSQHLSVYMRWAKVWHIGSIKTRVDSAHGCSA